MSGRRGRIFIDGVFEGPAMRLLFQSWWSSCRSTNNCTSSTIQCTCSTIQRTSSTIQGILRIIHLKAHTSSSRYILETPEYYLFTFMIIYWNYSLLAQLWRLTFDNKLVNKSGAWRFSDKIWKFRPQCILLFAFGSSSLDWWGTPCVKNRVSKKQQLGGGTHAKLSPKQFLTFYFFTEKKVKHTHAEKKWLN